MMVAARPSAVSPTSHSATSSIGSIVAERPMRWSGPPATCASRSRLRARWAPRRDSSTAWISSTMTVRTVRSISRLRRAVSRRYSDSGVVTRMWGGFRSMAARSAAGVSPERTAAVILGASNPISSAKRRISRRGSARFRWMSALSALRGETYRTRVSSGRPPARLSRSSRSSSIRNAARVLPDPVGAETSVCRPARIASQACRWALVGSPSRSANQRATAGWNPDKGIRKYTPLPSGEGSLRP